MVRTRGQSALDGMRITSLLEHPVVVELVGKNRYLQMAVSKAMASIYAAKFGSITSKRLSYAAAQDGYLSLLIWAKEIGCVWDVKVFLEAIERGQIPIMRWLVDKKCFRLLSENAFKSVAKGRSLQSLAWLHQNAYTWNAETYTLQAASAGWLEGLVWLRAHGCPWSKTLRRQCVTGNVER